MCVRVVPGFFREMMLVVMHNWI